MTISKWTAASGLAIALLTGLFVGRYATPERVVERERIVTIDREIDSHWEAYVGRTETVSRKQVVYSTRTEWKPDGTVTHTVDANSTSDTRSTSDVQQTKIEYREVIKYQDREKVKEIERAPDRWLFSAQAGTRIGGLAPEYGGSVQYRWGPLYLGPWIHKSDEVAAGIAVSVTF